MENNFKKIITYLRANKYQNSLINNAYLIKRNKAIFNIFNYKDKNIPSCKKNCCKNNFFFKNLNKNNIIKFYKKFNFNLKLKKNII